MADTLKPVLIDQAQLALELCEDIARLKMPFWPYSLASQVRWLTEQTEPDDRHLLLRDGRALIGYLRLTRRRVVDAAPGAFIVGVSTVVIAEGLQGRGLGALLMRAANDAILAEPGAVGALCCSTDKLPFYAKCGWALAQQPLVRADDPSHRFLQDQHDMTLGDGERLGAPARVVGKPF